MRAGQSKYGMLKVPSWSPPIRLSKLTTELRRRHVVKVALLYLATSWLLLQTADVLFPALRVEPWAFPLLLGLLLLFFVPALIFSWIYEMTPEGLKPQRDLDDHGSSEMITTGTKLNRVIVVLLVIAISTVAVDRLLPKTVTHENGDAAGPDQSFDSRAHRPAVTAESPLPADLSIAVLSFINVSDGPGAELFGDRIAERVMNLLADTGDFQVTSRSSAFEYRNEELNTLQMGQALNVANILEGSFHYFDDQIRVTAELIDSRTDQILWSEAYDRPLSSMLVVQDEIAAEIVDAVNATLLTGNLLADVTCNES